MDCDRRSVVGGWASRRQSPRATRYTKVVCHTLNSRTRSTRRQAGSGPVGVAARQSRHGLQQLAENVLETNLRTRPDPTHTPVREAAAAELVVMELKENLVSGVFLDSRHEAPQRIDLTFDVLNEPLFFVVQVAGDVQVAVLFRSSLTKLPQLVFRELLDRIARVDDPQHVHAFPVGGL